MNKLLSLTLKTFLVTLLCLSSFLIFLPTVQAHRPHDVIKQIEISPNYSEDSTIYIIVREELLKSEDGGKSWYRLFRGLDNVYDLSSLEIAIKNPQILYISTPGDGVYRSENGGLSWLKKNQGLDNKKINLLSVSFHSPDRVLAADKEGGLYLTNDGGNNWISVMNEQKITAISFAPDDDQIIMVGDSSGNIYLSSDQGLNWTKTIQLENEDKIQSIALSPTFSQDRTLWVGTQERGIFKSTDSGNSLTQVNQGLSDQRIRNIVPSPNYSQDSMVFASTWDEGVFQSQDQGKTWKKVAQGLTKNHQADEAKFLVPHFQDLKLSRNFSQDKTLFLGGFDGLFTSSNGGKNWQEIDTLSTRVITSLAISPNYKNDSTLAIGTYEKEAYISKDKGETWQPIVRDFARPSYRANAQPPIEIEYSRFYDLIFSPNYAEDQTLFATFLYKLFKSTNQGQLWQQISLPNVSGASLRDIYMAASPDFGNDGTLYLVTKHGGAIYRSTDKGKTFSVIHQLKNPTKYVVISPNFAEDQTLFVSGVTQLYKTIDGGKNWGIITKSPQLEDVYWLNLVISPNYKQDKTVFGGTNQGLFKTIDGGKTWQKLTGVPMVENAVIKAMAISPNYENDQTLIATVEGVGLVKTMDGGKTFQEIGGDFNQKHLLAEMVMSGSSQIHFSPDYANDQTIYGFGSPMANLYKSTDGGLNWELIFIPQKGDGIADFILNLRIAKILLNVYPALRFLLALIISLPVYFIVGFLKLEKRLPLSRRQVKLGASVSLFFAVFIVLSII